jgi:hypothetical protein
MSNEIPFWWQRIGCMRNPGCHTGEEAARDEEIADLRAEIERLRAAFEERIEASATPLKPCECTAEQRARCSYCAGYGKAPIERRRDLAHAKLPLDAEVALEHAALALSRSGQPQAHQQVIQVLAAHLPPLDGEDTEGGSHD